MESFVNVLLAGKISPDKTMLLPVDIHPFVVPTVISRMKEELDIVDFIIITRRETAESIRNVMNSFPTDVNIYFDNIMSKSLLKDNIFENLFLTRSLIKSLEGKLNRIYIDISAMSGPFAAGMMEERSNLKIDVVFTHVDILPLPGLPSYPFSPRWVHKVYIHGKIEPSQLSHPSNQEVDLPREIRWQGSKYVFMEISSILNSITGKGLVESFYDGQRHVPGEGDRLSIYASLPGGEEKKLLLTMDTRTGPSEEAVTMMYDSWKIISNMIHEQNNDVDKTLLDRVLMQIQRYTGSVDLVVKEMKPSRVEIRRDDQTREHREYKGWKIHSFLIDLVRQVKKPIALLPDTNMFYQGFHVTLLKASIKNGHPWSSIEGLRIYIPICAEAEINGKVAESAGEAKGLSLYSYIMALLANRAIDEVKKYYGSFQIPAVSPPCEASIAVVAQNILEEKAILMTADRKAYNAWQTINVCSDKVLCVYVGHQHKTINIDGMFSKYYASIVLANLLYVSSLFVNLDIVTAQDKLRLSLESLRGSNAPVVKVSRIIT
ncbi:hypothetical protein [Thermosphaera sp.]